MICAYYISHLGNHLLRSSQGAPLLLVKALPQCCSRYGSSEDLAQRLCTNNNTVTNGCQERQELGASMVHSRHCTCKQHQAVDLREYTLKASVQDAPGCSRILDKELDFGVAWNLSVSSQSSRLKVWVYPERGTAATIQECACHCSPAGPAPTTDS